MTNKDAIKEAFIKIKQEINDLKLEFKKLNEKINELNDIEE
ncbi:MAG: hypothetical protein AABW57_00885 [Nanoarchaeota archaeon]